LDDQNQKVTESQEEMPDGRELSDGLFLAARLMVELVI
jgi:hypothetical protein